MNDRRKKTMTEKKEKRKVNKVIFLRIVAPWLWRIKRGTKKRESWKEKETTILLSYYNEKKEKIRMETMEKIERRRRKQDRMKK